VHRHTRPAAPDGQWQRCAGRQELDFQIRRLAVLAIVDAGDEQVALRPGRRRIERAAHSEIAVAHGEQTFHLAFADGIEPFLFDPPGHAGLARA
jgi:hypothetical protein